MPKDSLQGLTTDSGWEIVEQITTELGSGGNFCSRYVVDKDGQAGFLKAMDLHEAFSEPREMKKLLDQYIFEQEISQFCADKNMTRVVTPFDAGSILVPNFDPPNNVAYYVIFEKADGDLRSNHLEVPEKLWIPTFTALHHVTVGINQLHRAEIAHQDIKPSNVLSFSGNSFKVSDLGRVVDNAGKSPFRGTHYPGDGGYKPLEMFFGINSLEFFDRLSCDMFMIGSLIYHVIEDIQLNVVVLEEVNKLNPDARHYDYNQALPYIHSAFAQVLKNFKENSEKIFGKKIAYQLHLIVSQMCNPDYVKRGNPSSTSRLDRIQMHRYISRLDLILKRLSIQGIK